MKRFRLTKAAKILIILLVVVILGGGAFAAVKTGFVKDKGNKTEQYVEKADKIDKSDKTINLSLDEWIGWKSIIDANGGLETQPGSIYDKLGIKVNINVINDATQSSNALIKGDLVATGYTINRVAFLSNKFQKAGLDVVMPIITNYSNGGDGIIANNKFKTVESLVDAKIGVPQFSEAHSLVVWFINQSDLPQEDKDKIIKNLIFFETPDEAAKAFFSGKIDVAATWQPYISQAADSTDSHVLFSTASSKSLIMDGILFRKDFAEANPETVQAFIDGALQAADLYDKQFDTIRKVMPMFSTENDESIKAMTEDAKLTSWKNNIEVLKGTAVSIYDDMCKVWESIGESVNKDLSKTLFDNSYIKALSSKYESIKTTEENTVKITEENKQGIIDSQALLSKSASVEFIINTSKFSDNSKAAAALDEFIKIAKQLDGTIIQIEGNTDPNPSTDPEDVANKMLSKQRAEAVKKYFVINGIDEGRIIVVGNGSSKPVVDNNSEENRAKNRRTDVYFKCIE